MKFVTNWSMLARVQLREDHSLAIKVANGATQ